MSGKPIANGSVNTNGSTNTNGSSNTIDPLANYERPWLRDELFAGTLTVISLYLVISLSIFEYRRNEEERRQKPKKKRDVVGKIEHWLSRGSLCLIAVIFTLIRCLCEQIELRLGQVSDIACRIYQHELVEVYHTALTCLYLLLWSRQLKMYKHRALRHLSSPLLRFISMIVLLGILGSSIATATSYLVTFTLISSPYGCVYDLSFPDGPPSSLPGILLFLIAFIFQFALLGLLVYPLVKHYRLHMCWRSDANQTHRNIRQTIIRLSICTTFCVLSDGVASNLLVFVHDGVTPIMFWANIYTVNLLVNIIAVICSFVDWRQRLLPCRKYSYESVAVNNSATSTSAV